MALPAFRDARIVMLYMPLPNEVDVTSLIEHGLREEMTVCVPAVDWDRREIRPVKLVSMDESAMRVEAHGVRVPADGITIPSGQLEAVIVPGLAFDARGNRLGRNAGFYDRFLTGLNRATTTIGVAFDRQIVENVPVEPHDVAVDCVVTESHVYGG
jgi:5-formyltetrahydrofolate cyclo-ligase